MSDLRKLIKERKAVVGVIGLGYVGLPLVRLYATKGFRTIGFDVDRQKVDLLNRGKSYIKSISSDTVRELLRQGRFEATDDFRKLRNVHAVIICVPTPLTAEGAPDLSFIKTTSETIARYLRKGQLIVLESTTYPGTTSGLMKPILERSGRKAGRDFFLAFSPEREDPGRKDYTNADIPKIVGGIDKKSMELAALLYEQAVVRVVRVSSCEVAESAKLLENIYRCVNIALVNELKIILDKMGVDVWEVIAAASTKPFGFQPFYPGPGFGGHCIPIDPFYLAWKAREYQVPARFIELAGEINRQMPFYVVNRLYETWKFRGKIPAKPKILVLGIAYKKDIDDPRESPSFKIMEILQEKGAVVRFHDPLIPVIPKTRHYSHLKATPVKLTAKTLRDHDAVIVVTDHSFYDYPWIAKHARLVIDTRNVVKIKPLPDHVIKA